VAARTANVSATGAVTRDKVRATRDCRLLSAITCSLNAAAYGRATWIDEMFPYGGGGSGGVRGFIGIVQSGQMTSPIAK
jgi:hypothetical protein